MPEGIKVKQMKKLNKKQKELIDVYYREFSLEQIVDYYSVNGYMMVALEVLGNGDTFGLEDRVRDYILNKYKNELYHYIANYEEEIKGERLL